MNYIVTITSKNYLKYTYRLIYSLREIGYKGEIIVLTPDDDIYCNCRIIKIEKIFTAEAKTLDDSRWLQFQLLDNDFFKDGDKIIYLDSDVIVHKGFDFERMFNEYTFAVSITHFDIDEFPILRKILCNPGIDFKYIATPFVFEVNDKVRDFFNVCKLCQEISNHYKRGTLLAFNLACYSYLKHDEIQIIPEDKVVYAYDMQEGRVFDDPMIIHYGGFKGKKIWEEEYYDNKPVSYILKEEEENKSFKREYNLKTKKNKDIYAFQTDEGLGNQIETYLIYRVLIEMFENVDIFFAFSDRDNEGNIKFYEIITKYFGNDCLVVTKGGSLDDEISKRYKGLFCCRPRRINNIPVLAEIKNYAFGSEVDRNNEMLYQLGKNDADIKRYFNEFLPLNWRKIRGDDYNDFLPTYDIVICVGSKHNLRWIKKRYLRMNEVIDELKNDYSIACVGHKDEYIYGCDDYTHLSLEETFDFVSKAKVVITMDSGLFHFVNLIGIENVGIFGGTNIEKNTNIKVDRYGVWGFHKFSTIISGSKCEKQPCQNNGWRLTADWDECDYYQCMMFPPQSIIGVVREKLLDLQFSKL